MCMSLMSLCHTNLISRLFCSFYVACSVGPDDDENCQTSSFSLTCEPSSYLPALASHGSGTRAISFCGHLSWPGQQSFHSFRCTTCPSPMRNEKTLEFKGDVFRNFSAPADSEGFVLRGCLGQKASAAETGLRRSSKNFGNVSSRSPRFRLLRCLPLR